MLLFPRSFAVSGNTVSVPNDAEEDGNNTVDMNKIPKRVVLTREDFARKCRMADARCYYTVQGKTCRDKHILLLGTSHKHFVMRERIVGMSRATHGTYVHVATPFDEERLLAVRHEELDLDHDIMCSGLGEGLDLDNMCSEHVVEDDDWGVYY